MKFNLAWANIVKENVSLKYALLVVSGIAVLSTIGFFLNASKDPIVIERTCNTKVIKKSVETQRSLEETKDFLKEALMQRFSTGIEAKDSFLAQDEIRAKINEEEILKKKNINQAVVIRSIFSAKNKVFADIDRVFAMGNTRPAYASKLSLEITTVQRTESNPYGMVLTKTMFLDQKEEKRND